MSRRFCLKRAFFRNYISNKAARATIEYIDICFKSLRFGIKPERFGVKPLRFDSKSQRFGVVPQRFRAVP
jgi:hypothetical protein